MIVVRTITSTVLAAAFFLVTILGPTVEQQASRSTDIAPSRPTGCHAEHRTIGGATRVIATCEQVGRHEWFQAWAHCPINGHLYLLVGHRRWKPGVWSKTFFCPVPPPWFGYWRGSAR